MDDAETNRKFAESLEADYPILSDADKRVANAYGVLGATGFSSRWTFYIDPDGRILDIDKKVMDDAYIVPGIWAKGLLYRPSNLTNVFITNGFQMYDYLAMGTTRK